MKIFLGCAAVMAALWGGLAPVNHVYNFCSKLASQGSKAHLAIYMAIIMGPLLLVGLSILLVAGE